MVLFLKINEKYSKVIHTKLPDWSGRYSLKVSGNMAGGLVLGCKVLKWGLFRLPAYVANVMKVFTKFSG